MRRDDVVTKDQMKDESTQNTAQPDGQRSRSLGRGAG